LSRVGSLLSTSFDAGVDLRDVQIAARHADPRTTMRYDRTRQNLDRHPNYILAAYGRPRAGQFPQSLVVDFGVGRGGQLTSMSQHLSHLGQRGPGAETGREQ
jgi:hypothetical protein